MGKPCGKPAVVCWCEVSSLRQLTKQQSVESSLRLDGGMPRVPMSSDQGKQLAQPLGDWPPLAKSRN